MPATKPKVRRRKLEVLKQAGGIAPPEPLPACKFCQGTEARRVVASGIPVCGSCVRAIAKHFEVLEFLEHGSVEKVDA